MTADELVEKVAAALFEHPGDAYQWDDGVIDREEWRSLARAALVAVREAMAVTPIGLHTVAGFDERFYTTTDAQNVSAVLYALAAVEAP